MIGQSVDPVGKDIHKKKSGCLFLKIDGHSFSNG
jgi:hypothetical protein